MSVEFTRKKRERDLHMLKAKKNLNREVKLTLRLTRVNYCLTNILD